MASVAQCREALETIAARMAADPDPSRSEIDRSFACHVTALGASPTDGTPGPTAWDFQGRISGGTIVGLADGDDPKADVRLSLSGDDLLALVDGSLHFARAWAAGRVSVHASFRDLLRLRKLM
jgi:hypothetical protein